MNQRAEVRPLAKGGRCPYCNSYIQPHCSNDWCMWVMCRDRDCRAFGTAERFVRVKGDKA